MVRFGSQLSFLNAKNFIGRVVLVLIYCIFYDYMFRHYLVGYFGYMGMSYQPMTVVKAIVFFLIVLMPFLLYGGIYKISNFINLIIYILVYIPVEHSLFVNPALNSSIIISYSIPLCLVFVLFFSTGTRFHLFNNFYLKPQLPFYSVEIVTVIFMVILLILRARSMRFVNIITEMKQMYEIRAQNSNSEMGVFIFLIGWLRSALFPYLLICYLHQNKLFKTILILIGYTLLFMIDMQRLTIILPIILVGMYYLINYSKSTIKENLHSILIFIITITYFVLSPFISNSSVFMILSIVFLRTVGISGWLGQIYSNFFINHPFTHYSHISVINAITKEYPYDAPLGYAVSNGSFNANANFLLTDGIAADGVVGIILIGIIFYILLKLIDAISFRYHVEDMIVIFIPIISELCNVSLFTTLLTHGLILLLFLLSSIDSNIVIKS